MSASLPKPNSNAWQNLQLLLRRGPDYIESTGVDVQTLMDMLQENDSLFNAMVDAFDGMIYICSMDFSHRIRQ